MPNILVVDDEFSIRESFSLILEGKYKVTTAASGEGALKAVADQKIDLAFLDIRMPGINGLETLERLKEIDPQVEVIMITAVNDVQKASEAIKLGARDYIIKPFDVETIQKLAGNLLRRKTLLKETSSLQKEGQKRLAGAIENDVLEKYAASDSPLLILGGQGTDKESLARLVHEKSSRNDLPFLAHNLSSRLSAAEVKALLFGAGKGFTTVELEKKAGLCEQAHGGTLFLNHIENLPVDLLAQLKSAEIRLIGGSSQETFSADFFAGAVISLPALSEQAPELHFLVKDLLENLNRKYGKEIQELSSKTDALFSNYSWPGNTHQLKCLLERLALKTTSNQIEVEGLPFDLLLKGSEPFGAEYISKFEKYFSSLISPQGQ